MNSTSNCYLCKHLLRIPKSLSQSCDKRSSLLKKYEADLSFIQAIVWLKSAVACMTQIPMKDFQLVFRRHWSDQLIDHNKNRTTQVSQKGIKGVLQDDQSLNYKHHTDQPESFTCINDFLNKPSGNKKVENTNDISLLQTKKKQKSSYPKYIESLNSNFLKNTDVQNTIQEIESHTSCDIKKDKILVEPNKSLELLVTSPLTPQRIPNNLISNIENMEKCTVIPESDEEDFLSPDMFDSSSYTGEDHSNTSSFKSRKNDKSFSKTKSPQIIIAESDQESLTPDIIFTDQDYFPTQTTKCLSEMDSNLDTNINETFSTFYTLKYNNFITQDDNHTKSNMSSQMDKFLTSTEVVTQDTYFSKKESIVYNKNHNMVSGMENLNRKRDFVKNTKNSLHQGNDRNFLSENIRSDLKQKLCNITQRDNDSLMQANKQSASNEHLDTLDTDGHISLSEEDICQYRSNEHFLNTKDIIGTNSSLQYLLNSNPKCFEILKSFITIKTNEECPSFSNSSFLNNSSGHENGERSNDQAKESGNYILAKLDSNDSLISNVGNALQCQNIEHVSHQIYDSAYDTLNLDVIIRNTESRIQTIPYKSGKGSVENRCRNIFDTKKGTTTNPRNGLVTNVEKMIKKGPNETCELIRKNNAKSALNYLRLKNIENPIEINKKFHANKVKDNSILNNNDSSLSIFNNKKKNRKFMSNIENNEVDNNFIHAKKKKLDSLSHEENIQEMNDYISSDWLNFILEGLDTNSVVRQSIIVILEAFTDDRIVKEYMKRRYWKSTLEEEAIDAILNFSDLLEIENKSDICYEEIVRVIKKILNKTFESNELNKIFPNCIVSFKNVISKHFIYFLYLLHKKDLVTVLNMIVSKKSVYKNLYEKYTTTLWIYHITVLLEFCNSMKVCVKIIDYLIMKLKSHQLLITDTSTEKQNIFRINQLHLICYTLNIVLEKYRTVISINKNIDNEEITVPDVMDLWKDQCNDTKDVNIEDSLKAKEKEWINILTDLTAVCIEEFPQFSMKLQQLCCLLTSEE